MRNLNEWEIKILRNDFGYSDILISNTQYLINCLMNRYKVIKKVYIDFYPGSKEIEIVTYDSFECLFAINIGDLILNSEIDFSTSIENLYTRYEKKLILKSMRG